MAPRSDEDLGVGAPTAAGATLTLWFILLAFGGGCLAWYYSSIRYFPEIAWEESLSYLAVLSIIGGVLVVGFGLLAFLPGVLWSELLISDCTLRHWLTYLRSDGKLEPCLVSVWKRIAWPFTVFMLPTHFLFLRAGLPTVCLAALILLASATWVFLTGLPPPVRSVGGGAQPARAMHPLAPHSRVAKYLACFIGSSLLGFASLLIILHFIQSNHYDWRLGFICTAVIVAANLSVSMLYATRRRFAAILVASFATLLMLVAGELSEEKTSLLHKIMESYGFGEGTRDTLVVTREGRELLEAQEIPVDPTAAGGGRVRDVAILSRLGTGFFVRCGRRRISLPKIMVASWSAQDPGRENPLKNSDVIELAKSGLTEDLVILKIEEAPRIDFDLTVKDLPGLKARGVSEKSIGAMLKRQASLSCGPKTTTDSAAPGAQRATRVGPMDREGQPRDPLP